MLINLTLVRFCSRAFLIPIITENTAAFLGFNHFFTATAFVKGLTADCRNLNRLLMANMLRHLSGSDFERVGRHAEVGPVSLGQFVRLYVHHLDHHMKFIREKRVALGVD